MEIGFSYIYRKQLILLILVTLCFDIFAQEIITDRPDQTESSSTIQSGSLQIESGILVGFSENDGFSERQILAPTTLFRYGLTNGIELRLLNQYELLRNQLNGEKISGISDIEVGTKMQLLKKEGVKTEIAFLTHLIIPSGSKTLSLDEFGSINKLSIAHDIGEKFGLGYNIGYDYLGQGNGDITYSIALGIRVSSKFGIFLEPYGALVDFDTHEANFDAGFTLSLQENLQADFSFGTGLSHTMNFISFGISWRIDPDE